MLVGMRRRIISVVAAATVLATLPATAQAHQLQLRPHCKDRPPAVTWDRCVRKTKRHNRVHRRAASTNRCVRAGGRREYCRAVTIAVEREPVPPRWAWAPQLIWIVDHESGFNACAVNPGRHICNYRGNRAYGYGQFLRKTEKAYRCRRRPSPPIAQARCVLRYAKGRYHSPRNAKRVWIQQGWW